MRCSHCQHRGATIGCRVERCPHSFHLHCARAAGCTFYPSQYIVACTTHAPAFKDEVQQQQGFLQSPYSAVRRRPGQQSERGPRNRKRGRTADEIEEYIRVAKAAHKHASMECRRKLAESSDDEEHFQRKEEMRLARDKARLNPVILRRPHPGEQRGMPSWESVGGLQHVVEQLKEMVLLPLLYPELFSHMRIWPPRGILFHGEPGTGKTLAARALAGACAQASPQPVAFFARKGADCLGKFSGEAERTLRLLFEEAAAQAPAIIFLDELDGLVPSRSQASSGSDQIYASVVSTMLALMDGVADRGAVIVIGATNRPEAIDAALRRPGRFDREVYFGLPSTADRAEILRVHTQRWEPQPMPQVIQAVAAATEGFAGADLQALCAGAVMAAVHRMAPTLLQQLEHHSMASQAEVLNPIDAPVVVSPETGATQNGGPSAEPGSTHADGQNGSRDEIAEAGATGQDETVSDHEQQGVPQLQAETQQEPLHLHVPGSRGTACDPGTHAGTHAAPGSAACADGEAALRGVQVQACDWREALAAAPEPCSRRQGLAALAADAARPLSACYAPALLPSLAAALRVLHASRLPLPAAAARAAATAAVQSSSQLLEPRGQLVAEAAERQRDELGLLRSQLVELGVMEAAGPHAQSGVVQHMDGRYQLPDPSATATPEGIAVDEHAHRVCRVLLAGLGERGQPQVAGALLQLLGSSVNVATVSLAQIVVAGSGDPAVGCISTVRQAVKRSAPGQLTVIFLPRIDGWAVTRTLIESEDTAEALCAFPGTPASRSCSRNGHDRLHQTMSSPFRGLVSLEARESPSRAWSAHASPSAAKPSRLSASFSPFSTPSRSPRPHISDINLPALGRRLSGALDAHTTCNSDLAVQAVLEQTDARQPVVGSDSAPEHAATNAEGKACETVSISELWMVFEQILGEVSPSQPTLIVATCHCEPSELPPLLASFFGGGGSTGNQSAVARVISMDAVLPVMEARPTQAGPEHLLQERRNTEATRVTRKGKESAAGRENAAFAEPSAGRFNLALNAAQKERGYHILGQLQDGIKWCGHALRKSRLLRSVALARELEASCPTGVIRVAEAAAQGSYNTLQEFQAAFHDAARWHCGTRSKHERLRDPALATIAALRDQVDSWCYNMKSALKLNNPEVLMLLRGVTS